MGDSEMISISILSMLSYIGEKIDLVKKGRHKPSTMP